MIIFTSITMSYEERKLMQLMDEQILNATTEELTKLQQIDISTQLDGSWFYDNCDLVDKIQEKSELTADKLFSK